jgi:hypothetical protein
MSGGAEKPQGWRVVRTNTVFRRRFGLLAFWCLLLAAQPLAAGEQDPFEDLERPKQRDPFEGLEQPAPPEPSRKEPARPGEKGWLDRFFHDNFTFKKELYSQFSYSDDLPDSRSVYSRQSVGFEVLKKFSTRTSTVAAVNVQGRFVRRDNYFEVVNDMEGAEREGWSLEVHNAYLDLYNILNPVLDETAKGEQVGRFNLRLGRFYLPFGINLQTDTHGTLLQLSNDRNFGFERDWYAGLWGALNSDVNYDVYYLLGTGYDLSFKGQSGMLGARFSLANRYLNRYGLEAGLAVMAGQRVAKDATMRSPSVAAESDGNKIVDTLRVGLDWRYTRSVPTGSLAFTTELSGGEDTSDGLFTQLHQLEYLNRGRHWGLDTQYRRFWQDIRSRPAGGPGMEAGRPRKADSSLFGEFTWYFRNDLGNTNLHWIKLNVERQLERQQGRKNTILTLQYYRYW